MGAPADVVVLDYPAPAPLTASSLAGHWVFGLDARCVRDVYVAGQLVVEAGRSTRLDGVDLAAKNSAQAARLWTRVEQVPPHDFAPAEWRTR